MGVCVSELCLFSLSLAGTLIGTEPSLMLLVTPVLVENSQRACCEKGFLICHKKKKHTLLKFLIWKIRTDEFFPSFLFFHNFLTV